MTPPLPAPDPRRPSRAPTRAAVAIALAGLGGFAGLALAPADARAQVPTVIDPGAEPEPEPAPEPEPEPQQPIFVPVQPGVEIGPDGQPIVPEDDDGFFFVDGADIPFEPDQFGGGALGPLPQFHVVRRGDTLWDICWFYFNNPWEWPKVWSYNPSITNPHWIYPGDLIRMYPGGLAPQLSESGDPDAQESPDGPVTADIQPTPARRTAVKIRNRAFVTKEELDVAARVVGAPEEKTLLSAGDGVYLEFPRGEVPKLGDRFTIYTEQQRVTHPDGGKVVGSYVRILGELVIESVKVDRRPYAKITQSVDVIERGALVGPLERTFRTVEPKRNERELRGTIVAMLDNDQLIGEGQLIFIDVGEKDGVKVGNRMLVVRRGDAYSPVMKPGSKAGQDDRRFPDHAVGEVMIVQTGPRASVALVTLSVQEIGVGDAVEMRKSRN